MSVRAIDLEVDTTDGYDPGIDQICDAIVAAVGNNELA